MLWCVGLCRPRWGLATGANFAEAPGFCVGNFAANLKREISHTKMTAPEIPPPHICHCWLDCSERTRPLGPLCNPIPINEGWSSAPPKAQNTSQLNGSKPRLRSKTPHIHRPAPQPALSGGMHTSLALLGRLLRTCLTISRRVSLLLSVGCRARICNNSTCRQGTRHKMSALKNVRVLWAEGHLSCSCLPNGAHKCSLEGPRALF